MSYSFTDKELLEYITNLLKANNSISKRVIDSNSTKSREVNTYFYTDLDLYDLNEELGDLPAIPIITLFIDSESDANDNDYLLPTIKQKTNLIMQVAYLNLKRAVAYQECKSFAEEIRDYLNSPEIQINLDDRLDTLKANQIKRLGARNFKEKTILASYRISFLVCRS